MIERSRGSGRTTRMRAKRQKFEADDPVSLVVCRGCCCGTSQPGPAEASTNQLAAFRELARSCGAQLTLSGCLGPCADADVVVVRPSQTGRRAGGRPTWFGTLAAGDLVALREWVRAGGPGVADLPDRSGLRLLPRPSRSTSSY